MKRPAALPEALPAAPPASRSGGIVRVLAMSILRFRPTALVMLLVLAAGLAGPAATAQTSASDSADPGTMPVITTDTAPVTTPIIKAGREPLQHVAIRLVELDDQIELREKELVSFRESIRGLTAEQLSVDQKTELENRRSDLRSLKATFEQIALGGLDTGPMQPELPKSYNWQAELLEILRPVLASLKDLTDKPRRVEATRQRINQLDRQIRVTQEALQSLEKLNGSVVDKDVRDELKTMNGDWIQRRLDLSGQRDVAQIQLSSMLVESRTNWEIIREATIAFFEGRGLTLSIAALAAAIVWLLVRLALLIVRRIRRIGGQSGKQRKVKLRRDRAFRYLNRFATGVLMALAVLGTFYARSDVFLLALSILAIVGLALGLRHILPRFYAEIKLLLDFGSVRDSERIVYEGVPMQVKEMSTFAILANPMLKGFIRLPLRDLAEKNSHPAASDPWFPTRQNDYVMLGDGGLAQVVEQSVDTVVLRQLGALRHLRTADFFAASPSNLSTDGFVVPVTFGIAYRHQAISLTEVPQKIGAAVDKMVENADWREQCTGVIVEFKEAATNSLDYLIVIKMVGDAAGSYFGIGRAVQRTLVALCNEQDWEIPFTQLTVHQAQD